MGTSNILLGSNPVMDVFYLGGSSNNPRHASCYGNGDKLRPFGLVLPCVTFKFCL